jgi:integral membrane protein
MSERTLCALKEEVVSNKAAFLFRVAAVAEAISWAGLLIGMFFKYVVGAGQGGVPVLGMVHGVVFLAYLVVSLSVIKPLGWRRKTLVLALLASIPPLFTWWFEKWALRSGKLDGRSRLAYGGTGLFQKETASV